MAPDARIDRYELLSPIGESERAAVFQARDTRLRQPVVLKRFKPAGLPAGSLARYAAAVAALKKADVRGVVLPIELVTDGPTPFAVFTPLPGESLASAMLRHEPCSWPSAAELIGRCAEVLAATAAATGQSHRALKPTNIWRSPTGEVVLLDLGIAELGVSVVPPRTGPVFVDYRAPEQLEGGAGDDRVDVFTLGVLLHELATGLHPFAGSSAFQVVRRLLLAAPQPLSTLTRDMSPGAAREAEKLLQRSLARTPAERFGSAREFLQALQFARRVIGTPVQRPLAEEPPQAPAPARPLPMVEDPTTMMQIPGAGWQRRLTAAHPPEPAPAAEPQAPAAPTPSSPVALQAAAHPSARPVESPLPLLQREPIAARVSKPAVTPFTIPDDRTELLPARPRPAPSPAIAVARAPLAEITEPMTIASDLRQAIASEPPDDRTELHPRPRPPPARIEVPDELGTVAFTRLTAVPPRTTTTTPEVDEPTTIVIAAPAPTQPARRMAAPVDEGTLLLPPEATNHSTPTRPASHRLLIALNALCIVLIVLGLLYAALV